MNIGELFGFAGPVGTGEPEEPLPSPPQNPWLGKPGQNGCLEYVDEDAEERELANVFAPLEKLFRPDTATVAPASAPRFQFSKRASSTTPAPQVEEEGWDSPVTLEKRAFGRLTYKTRRDEDGILWSEGYDAAGVLQCCLVVFNEND